MKVGFNKEGKTLALDVDIYNNGGNSLDLSASVLERAMFHSDNCYSLKDMRVRGQVCFTNQSSNTAFRGFGGPQGMLIVENWIERIAHELGRRPEEIRVCSSLSSPLFSWCFFFSSLDLFSPHFLKKSCWVNLIH